MPELPERKRLPHDVPDWVEDGAAFFITICAAERRSPVLTSGSVPSILTGAVEHYHSAKRWYCHLFLVMPDHVHGLFSFPQEERLRMVIAQWKSYTAKAGGFRWQGDFFDHRLRAEESFDEKAHYIRMNPVRAGLVESRDDWRHTWQPTER